jgi:hypothetical protein
LIPAFIEDWHFKAGFYPFFGQFSAKLWLYDTDLQRKIEIFLAKISDIAQNCYSGMPCATVHTHVFIPSIILNLTSPNDVEAQFLKIRCIN